MPNFLLDWTTQFIRFPIALVMFGVWIWKMSWWVSIDWCTNFYGIFAYEFGFSFNFYCNAMTRKWSTRVELLNLYCKLNSVISRSHEKKIDTNIYGLYEVHLIFFHCKSIDYYSLYSYLNLYNHIIRK